MHLTNYITEDLVFVVQGPADKHALLQRFLNCVKQHFLGVKKKVILERLKEREERVSSVIGHGVAITHTVVEGLESTLCVLAQIPEGVDFKAIDEEPVNVAFMILSPPEKLGEHIKLLSRIARLVSNVSFIARISKANNAREVFALIIEEDERHA